VLAFNVYFVSPLSATLRAPLTHRQRIRELQGHSARRQREEHANAEI
jgi:hypothetical protein